MKDYQKPKVDNPFNVDILKRELNMFSSNFDTSINVFEDYVKNTIKRIESLEEGLSPKEGYKIQEILLRKYLRHYIITFGTKHKFMIDENEWLRFENLKDELETAIAVAISKYKTKHRKDIIKILSSIVKLTKSILKINP